MSIHKVYFNLFNTILSIPVIFILATTTGTAQIKPKQKSENSVTNPKLKKEVKKEIAKSDTSLTVVSNSHSVDIKLVPADKLSKEYTDALKQVLKLDTGQYNKMFLVNKNLIDKIDALVYSSKDYPSFQKGIKVADKERLTKYRSILSPDQLKSYTEDSTLTGLNKVIYKNSVNQKVQMKDSKTTDL
jgi:hypothetical protein